MGRKIRVPPVPNTTVLKCLDFSFGKKSNTEVSYARAASRKLFIRQFRVGIRIQIQLHFLKSEEKLADLKNIGDKLD